MYTLLIGHNGSILFRQRQAILRERVPDGTFEVYDTGKGPLRQLRALGWSLVMFVRFAFSRQRRNVVFHGAYSPTFWILMLLPSVRGIAILQGSELNTVFSGWRASVVRIILTRSELVVCRNAAQQDDVQRLTGVPADRCLIVHWGLNQALFDLPRPPAAAKVVMISPRATQPEYNIPAIFEAVERLRHEGHSLHFIYVRFNTSFDLDVGDASDEELNEPRQADLWNAIARSDIAVSVPDYDGLSNTLMETLALGTFSISSDVAPNAFLASDSRLGDLVNVASGNAEETTNNIYGALKHAIARIDEIRQGAAFRRDYARQHFRIGRGVDELCEALRA